MALKVKVGKDEGQHLHHTPPAFPQAGVVVRTIRIDRFICFFMNTSFLSSLVLPLIYPNNDRAIFVIWFVRGRYGTCLNQNIVPGESSWLWAMSASMMRPTTLVGHIGLKQIDRIHEQFCLFSARASASFAITFTNHQQIHPVLAMNAFPPREIIPFVPSVVLVASRFLLVEPVLIWSPPLVDELKFAFRDTFVCRISDRMCPNNDHLRIVVSRSINMHA